MSYSQYVSSGVKRVIELDVDGVIADIHNGLNNYVYDEFNVDFNGERDIHTWGMKELDPEIRKFILARFSCPDFISNLDYIDGSIEALIMLDIMVRQLGWEIKLNTNVNSECIDARKCWLTKMLRETGVKADFVVDNNLHKIMLNDSYVVVDDNADNIRNSKAKLKFLIRRGHNRDITQSDLETNDNYESEVFIVKHLLDVVSVLEDRFKTNEELTSLTL